VYRAFLREPGEASGHGILDEDSLPVLRSELETMDFPEGAFVYIRYGRPNRPHYVQPDKDVEAYKVENGRLNIIYSRYKGGEWPSTWYPTLEDYEEIKKRSGEIGLAKSREEEMGDKIITITLPPNIPPETLSQLMHRHEVQKDIYKESREKWLKEHWGETTPRKKERTYSREERKASKRRRKLSSYWNILHGMGYSEDEIDEALKEIDGTEGGE